MDAGIFILDTLKNICDRIFLSKISRMKMHRYLWLCKWLSQFVLFVFTFVFPAAISERLWRREWFWRSKRFVNEWTSEWLVKYCERMNDSRTSVLSSCWVSRNRRGHCGKSHWLHDEIGQRFIASWSNEPFPSPFPLLTISVEPFPFPIIMAISIIMIILIIIILL